MSQHDKHHSRKDQHGKRSAKISPIHPGLGHKNRQQKEVFVELLRLGNSFYQEQSARLAQIAESLGVPTADVEDVILEAWTDAVRHRHDFRTRAQLRSWLEKAIQHKTMDFFRRRARRIPTQALASLHEEARDCKEEDRARQVALRQSLAAMLRRLRRRRPRDAWLLCAHYLKGRKLEDVANAAGMSVHAVRNRINRALQELRRLAGEEDRP